MTEHHITLKDPPKCPLYQLIKDKIKTVEGRINIPKYSSIKKGNTLIIHAKQWNLCCQVTYVKKYKTLRDYLEKETIERAIPCVATIEEAIKIYNTFSSPKKEKILEKSMVMIS